MISDQNSSFKTDESHSSGSTSDCNLIEFYHRLREESLTVMSQHVKDLKVIIQIYKEYYWYILMLCNLVTKDMHSGSTEGFYTFWWKQESNSDWKGDSGVF
jgi:hypothetical protein